LEFGQVKLLAFLDYIVTTTSTTQKVRYRFGYELHSIQRRKKALLSLSLKGKF
jgi:hypothetical protein